MPSLQRQLYCQNEVVVHCYAGIHRYSRVARILGRAGYGCQHALGYALENHWGDTELTPTTKLYNGLQKGGVRER